MLCFWGGYVQVVGWFTRLGGCHDEVKRLDHIKKEDLRANLEALLRICFF